MGLTWEPQRAHDLMDINSNISGPFYAALRPTGARSHVVPGRTPIAARVQAVPEFESTSVPAQSGQFTLYTRAADQVEAAISLQVGRRIDIRA